MNATIVERQVPRVSTAIQKRPEIDATSTHVGDPFSHDHVLSDARIDFGAHWPAAIPSPAVYRHRIRVRAPVGLPAVHHHRDAGALCKQLAEMPPDVHPVARDDNEDLGLPDGVQ
jgi:hypothetical protein